MSNYNLKEGYASRLQAIPALIKSFSNTQGTDYHQAIHGIIIGNEPRLNGFSVEQCIQFTKDWASVEHNQFPSYRKLAIGHPVDFATYGGQYPCWGFWDPLLKALSADDLAKRLFLAPQTYNDAAYLFKNAEGSGKGWVDLTYDKYRTPICFTEIGRDRTKPDHVQWVKDQLSGCLSYGRNNPQKLTGACFFSFTDKVWMQGTSEGSFGAHTHGRQNSCTITYSEKDFTHRDYKPKAPAPIPIGTLNVDVLQQTDLYAAVQGIYKGA